MRALLNAHLFYMVPRYDIKADRELKTLAKYYMADMRLLDNFMLSYPEPESLLLENRVCFELLRRGYKVYNGKLTQDEIKFMAENSEERAYVQIAGKFDEQERRGLLTPLRRIKDDNPKVIVCSESETRSTADGVMIINAAEFLMGASWKRK
jgi:predicted AAA+ superfamily ATPase